MGRHRLDLFVEGMIVVELKAIKVLENAHYVIVKEHGLLLNFAKSTLEVKSIICQRARTFPGFLAS